MKSNLKKIQIFRHKIIKVLYNKKNHKDLNMLKVGDVHKLFTLSHIHKHQMNKLQLTFVEYFKFRNEIQSKIPRYNMDFHTKG